MTRTAFKGGQAALQLLAAALLLAAGMHRASALPALWAARGGGACSNAHPAAGDAVGGHRAPEFDP